MLPGWVFHLSTTAMLGAVANVVSCGRTGWWSFGFMLLLLCTCIVLFTPQCNIAHKYEILLVKLSLLAAACVRSRRHARFGWSCVWPATLGSALYICLVDVRRVYGCVPTKSQYVACFGCAVLVYLSVWAASLPRRVRQ